MCFCAPYEVPGTGVFSSVILVVDVAGGPYTASDDGYITFTPGLISRNTSRICRVESRLTFRPRSKSASAAPDMMPWRMYIRFRFGVKRDLQVSKEVRSAPKHRVSALDFDFVTGRLGSKTSVRVSFETRGSSRRADARACPMKPPAPVIMQLIFDISLIFE